MNSGIARCTPARVLLLLALVYVSARPQSVPIPSLTQFQWSPLIEFDNQLFPAAILALATRRVEKLPSTYLGDPNGALGVAIISPTAGARVKVSIRVDRLAEDSNFEAVIGEAGKRYEVFPPMRFNVGALAKIRESFPTTAVFSVWAEGALISEQTRTIQVRAVNDVPLAFQGRDGKVHDFSPLFAAFVNENHPWIDGVLRDTLRTGAVRQFAGYQGTPEDAIRQVFAIWNTLQRQQVRYSSITQPSGASQGVFSQHVRFLDESIRYSQANCVDGTVLFASILYKIGLSPVLVLKPGHMFLGVYLSPPSSQTPNRLFLETTLIGNPGLNSVQRQWKFLTADGYKSSESYRQFSNAVTTGNQEFQSMVNSLSAHTPGYSLIDVASARMSGIAAIPRF